VALVAPQLAVDAADRAPAISGSRPFRRRYRAKLPPSGLMRALCDRRVGSHFNKAPGRIVAYRAAISRPPMAGKRGRRRSSHQGALSLWDALYGDEGQVALLGGGGAAGSVLLSATPSNEGREHDALGTFWTSGACLHQGPPSELNREEREISRPVRPSRQHGDVLHAVVAARRFP